MWGGMVGNCGLYNRKFNKMKQIINFKKYEPGINEDGYFSLYSSILKFSVPDFETASQFSVETVYYQDPVGMHKPLTEYISLEKLNEIINSSSIPI